MYSKKEFLEALRARGYSRSERWLEEWIERGLLDQGTRTTGASGAPVYVWPADQLELASSLLFQVEKRGAHRASLANLVVCVWLWWGDAFVPFRQVPRALLPWRAAEREAAEVHVRAAAREVVAKLAHKRAIGKRRLARTLVQMSYETPDFDQLRDAFEDVFDPDRKGLERGPIGAQLSTDRYLQMVALRTRTLDALETFNEAEYRAAAELYRWSRREYTAEQPRYAADPDLGGMHEAPTDNELANSACHDLVTCLGLLREHAQGQQRAAPPRPS